MKVSRRFVSNRSTRTCTVTHSFVFNNVFMMEGFEDFNFPFELAEVLGCAVLQLLHGHHLPCAVQQGVVPAHLHGAKVPLNRESGSGGIITDAEMLGKKALKKTQIFLMCSIQGPVWNN